MRATPEMIEAARAKGEQMAGNQPGALVKAMGDIAVAGLLAALPDTTPIHAPDQQAEIDRLLKTAERYMLAVKRLGQQSGYNKLTYFEAPISKMPTDEMAEEAAARWLELNNSGQALTAAVTAIKGDSHDQ